VNDKWHFCLSITKSLMRIAACFLVLFSGNELIKSFAVVFMVAELFGILEEIFDERE